MCPNYTLFDQTTFTCRFINTVDCPKSEDSFHRNLELYVTAEPAAGPNGSTLNNNYKATAINAKKDVPAVSAGTSSTSSSSGSNSNSSAGSNLRSSKNNKLEASISRHRIAAEAETVPPDDEDGEERNKRETKLKEETS